MPVLPLIRSFGLAGLLLAGTALAAPAQAQSFLGLGYLVPQGSAGLGGANTYSVATGISANGGLVTGYAASTSLRNVDGSIYDPVDRAITWTAAGGLVGQPVASPLYVPSIADDYDAASRNMAASANGGVVVGWAKTVSNNPSPGTAVQATMITGGSLTLLGYLVPDSTDIPDPTLIGAHLPLTSMALGVSGDGSIVVGSSYNGIANDIQGFFWTAGGGMKALVYLAGSPPGESLS